MTRSALSRDRHALYEASVQSTEFDLDFFETVWRSRHGGRFTRLREDFCGTAALAAEWVLRRPANRAWGVDLHAPTLAWAERWRLSRLPASVRRRLVLREANVLDVTTPRVDVIAALNFSYWVFHDRDTLRSYFRVARRSLVQGGLLFANTFGGTEAMKELVETRRIPSKQAIDGGTLPPFTYVWEHRSFNPVDHRLRCDIHFRFRDGHEMKRAFRYDWRLWTLPELTELMREAGFARADVYVEGWDDDADESDETYRLRKRFENQDGWLAYVVGEA